MREGEAGLARIDVDTLHREEADTLALNDIGRVEVTTRDGIVPRAGR